MTFWKGMDLKEALFSLGHVDSSLESALLTHTSALYLMNEGGA